MWRAAHERRSGSNSAMLLGPFRGSRSMSVDPGLPGVHVRRAEPGDVDVLLSLIRELAAFEREPDAVLATPADLARALFPDGAPPLVHCHVAVKDGRVVALAVWFVSFSTWEGRHGIYLEDLYVREGLRGLGVGRALLAAVAAEAVAAGYPRLEWSALDWNEGAITFYRRAGAADMPEWTRFRLSGPRLHELGGSRAAAD